MKNPCPDAAISEQGISTFSGGLAPNSPTTENLDYERNQDSDRDNRPQRNPLSVPTALIGAEPIRERDGQQNGCKQKSDKDSHNPIPNIVHVVNAPNFDFTGGPVANRS